MIEFRIADTFTDSLARLSGDEQKADKTQEAAREKELAAEKESPPVTYDITIANADLPGLPAPETTNSVAAAKLAQTGSPADEIGEVEAGVPQRDPDLRESERILADYAALEQLRSSLAVAGH